MQTQPQHHTPNALPNGVVASKYTTVRLLPHTQRRLSSYEHLGYVAVIGEEQRRPNFLLIQTAKGVRHWVELGTEASSPCL